MSETIVNKKRVQAYFTEEKSRLLLKLGLAAIAVGLLLLATNEDGARTGPSVLVLVLGGVMLFGQAKRATPQEKHHPEVVKAKSHYARQTFSRSFRKLNVDIDELRDLNSVDLPGFEDADLDEALQRKSQFLWGYPKQVDFSRFAKVAGSEVFEATPMRISVLYLTRDEMFVYVSDVDIINGDLKTEDLHRFYLKEIVGVSSSSTTTRFKKEGNEPLFDSYKNVTGNAVEELVEIGNSLVIARTDGKSLQLPMGRSEIADGTKGLLDTDDDGDVRFDEIVRKLTQTINDAKKSNVEAQFQDEFQA